METEAKQEHVLMTEQGHLNDGAAALMVEAMLHQEITDVPEVILTHVEACRGCKDKIMEVVTFLRNPDSAGKLKQKLLKKAKNRRDWHFYRGKIAAVFVVFALLASAYFFIFKNPSFIKGFLNDPVTTKQDREIQSDTTTSTPMEINPNEKKAVVNPDSEKRSGVNTDAGKKSNGHLSVSQYRVNPNLENMIGSRLRSGLFEVLGPGNGSVIKEPIHFSWKKELVSHHTLKIVNNKNEILYTYPVQGRSFDFNESLASGLYYWKLESQNELLYVGKFFIGSPPLSRAP